MNLKNQIHPDGLTSSNPEAQNYMLDLVMPEDIDSKPPSTSVAQSSIVLRYVVDVIQYHGRRQEKGNENRKER